VEASTAKKAAMAGATLVLVTLCAAQFLMTLDTSVMNVAIATVAKDTNTTVTGVQTAITLYALVMAALMITGGKIGALIGRKRAFSIGCVIYGVGSFTTSLAHSLTVLIIGWSFLEGVGAALILPAVVALVAANFPAEQRPKSYGLVSAAGAVAVAVGPLIGGLFTTYWSWRYVFAGEVLIVIAILILGRGIVDEPPGERPKLDVVGVILSASGLSLAVFGVLKSGTWGWFHPKSGAPELWGVSLTMWFIVGGVFLLWLFLEWEGRREERGQEPLVNRTLFRVRQLRGGLRMFFFQYFIQSGVFFVVPLFLSVALGLSAIDTGVRLLPLSITLLISAIGVPRFFPEGEPATRGATRAARDAARRRRPARGGRRRCDGEHRVRSAPAARPRDRCACLAARERHRLLGPGRDEPRGRRPAEHRDEHRHVARDCACRRCADRDADERLPDGPPEQP
jgi:MFS family permease